jgi:lipopolysaccharide/colanic/teichoic acid biosynthesis glycosyltransferase
MIQQEPGAGEDMLDAVNPTEKGMTVSRGYLAAKRGLDIALCVPGLLALSPLFLFTALAIKIESPGPILFRQLRVGRAGRPFYCLKFRSMSADAESRKADLAHLNEVDGPVFKIKHDPRITRVGRILRKYSLDELPQLINVVRGEMTLVGPRPPLPREVEQYDDWMLRRLDVAPGITCLWQISGRSDTNFEQWMRLDMEYIETRCFVKDVSILLRTIPAVLFGRGAY